MSPVGEGRSCRHLLASVVWLLGLLGISVLVASNLYSSKGVAIVAMAGHLCYRTCPMHANNAKYYSNVISSEQPSLSAKAVLV